MMLMMTACFPFQTATDDDDGDRFHFRQLQMMMMMIQTNPGLLPALGRGFAALSAELERMEKFKELEVWLAGSVKGV